MTSLIEIEVRELPNGRHTAQILQGHSKAVYGHIELTNLSSEEVLQVSEELRSIAAKLDYCVKKDGRIYERT